MAFAASIGAMTLMPLAVTGTNLAFPEIEATFADTSRSVLSWALSGYSIVIAAFTLLGGQLTDRWDAKRSFLAGLAVFAAASLIAAVAPTPTWLIAGRSAQGIGGALIVPASLLLAVSEFAPVRRPLVIAVWTAAFPIGSALAPTLTAVVLQIGSWRWVFLVMAITSVVIGAVIASLPVRLDDGRRHDGEEAAAKARPDVLGIVLGTGAVALIALAIVQGPSWGWLDARTVLVGTFGVALLPVFVRRSLRHPRPLMDLRLFELRTYSVATTANVFISMAGTAVWLIWPLVMTNQWGYSQLRVGLAISITPALAGSISVLSAKWAQANGYRWLLIPGSVFLLTANLWYLIALGPEPDYLSTMLPGLVLYGVGMGLTFAPVNAAALLEVPSTKYGQANAGFSTVRFLASALGIAAVIAAIGEAGDDAFAGYDRAFAVLAIVSAAALVLVATAWPRHRVAPAA